MIKYYFVRDYGGGRRSVCCLSILLFYGLYCGYTVYYTVPKEIGFPRYNMKCSRENVILRGKFHVVSCFPLHFILYRRNLDYILDSVEGGERILINGHSSRAHGLAMASNTFHHLFFVGEKGGGQKATPQQKGMVKRGR